MAEVTLGHAIAFIRAHSLRLWDKYVGLPEHVQQQIKERMEGPCSTCLKNKACAACGCDAPDIFFDIEPCDGRTYPRLILDKQEWENQRRLAGH